MPLPYKRKLYISVGTIFGIFFPPFVLGGPGILRLFSFYDDRILIEDFDKPLEIPLKEILEVGTANFLIPRFLWIKFQKSPHYVTLSTYLSVGQSFNVMEEILELFSLKCIKINGKLRVPKGIKIITKTDEEIEKETRRHNYIGSAIVLMIALAVVVGFFASLR